LKLNGMHQFLVYADVVKVLGSCLHTTRVIPKSSSDWLVKINALS